MSNCEITLYVWPSQWGLHSMEQSCLAAVLYLQQSIPGRFVIAECNDPGISPTGQLPFLVHEQHTLSSLRSIIKYVAGLKIIENARSKPGFSVPLSSIEQAKTTAWCAHVESHLGDLVSYALYSNQANWVNMTHPALVNMYSIPQRYYTPFRLREMHRLRLQMAGLWDLPTKENEEKKPFEKEKTKAKEDNKKVFQETFSREKVLEKTRDILDVYARLVADRNFIYREKPTTLDIVLAAHILLLVEPEYPDPYIKNLIQDSYPSLILHARRVFGDIMESQDSQLQISCAPKFVWRSLFPWPPPRWGKRESEEEIQYRRMRWGFYGVALGTMAAYMLFSYHTLARRVAFSKNV